MKYISKDFINQMEKELKDNSYKGKWGNLKPNSEELFWQIMQVTIKLQKAIKTKNQEEIKEYSADLANYAEKAYCIFGIKDCSEEN